MKPQGDERDICEYLGRYPGLFISLAEISRRAGGRRYSAKDRDWIVGVLTTLVDRGVVEVNNDGRYRLKPVDRKKDRQRWVSPQMQQILEKSGKTFDGVTAVDAEET